MSDIRFGIIGCGVIGPWHANALTYANGARLAAVCDVVKEKAEAVAGEFGSPKVYTDYRDLLSDPEIDAVCLCTPSGMHARMGIEAASAGKHVLTEKPIDVNLSSVDSLISACRESDVRLGVIFQRRVSPVWNLVRAAVRDGRLGRMLVADAYMKYFRGQEYYDSAEWRGTWALDGGGALMNQGIHCIDMMQWIMGPVSSVFAHVEHLTRDIEVEDTAVAVVKYASGALGVIEGTTSINPGMEHRLEFHGELGSICIEGERICRWEVPGEKPDILEGARDVDIKSGTAGTDPRAVGTEGHRLLIEGFVRSIRDGVDPIVTGDEGRKALEIILAIYESAGTGRLVKLS